MARISNNTTSIKQKFHGGRPVGFMFEDREGKEWFFKDDYLERLAWLGTGGEWSDPIRAMEAMGHRLVGADDSGLRWLAANGFDRWVTVDDQQAPVANSKENLRSPGLG